MQKNVTFSFICASPFFKGAIVGDSFTLTLEALN